MKKRIYSWSKFTGLLIIALVPSIGTVFAQGFSQQTQNKLQQVLKSFQNDPSFVGGMSVAIKVDGLAFWQGASGYAARNIDAQNNLLPGGTNFTTSTLSRIYSVTKTFTAALVLELAGQGIFSLDDPVNNYIPLHLINQTLNGSVTIRQLLAHESGYSDYTDETNLQIAVAFQPTHVWTPFEMLTFVHQINQPGTVRKYSSTNYIILGAIIEAATGKRIEKLYKERFFEPLGLTSMYLDVRESQKSGTTLAAPHDNISAFNPIFQFTGQPTFPDAYPNISALPFTAIGSLEFTGGGIISNIADLAEWGNALYGGRATTKAVLDSMLNSISSTPDEYGNKLGYGIKNTPFISGSFDFIGHNGSAPGYRSVMFYNAERKMTIAVLTNFAGVSPYDIAKALYAALPEFTCGNTNKKEDKVKLCFNGNSICVDRNAADEFIKKGAYLGDCGLTDANRVTSKDVTKTIIKNSLQVFPNPSSGQIQFSFVTEESGHTTINLYDANGKLVQNVYHGNLQKGTFQEIVFARGKLAAGMYVAILKTTSGVTEKKIVFTK